MYTVYMHQNKLNGKVYIGITSVSPQERWRNGQGYIKQLKFYNAILKYGWDSFDHIILFENLTKEEAEEKEISLIAEYQSMNDEYGYNQKPGGSVNGPEYVGNSKNICCYDRYGKLVGEYPSIHDAARNFNCSPQNISAAMKNNKMAKDLMWRTKSEEPPTLEEANQAYLTAHKFVPIVAMDLTTGKIVEVFDSQKDACLKYGLSSARVSRDCSSTAITYNRERPIFFYKQSQIDKLVQMRNRWLALPNRYLHWEGESNEG